MDDDCLPEKNWLSKIRNILKEHQQDRIVFQGKINNFYLKRTLTSQLHQLVYQAEVDAYYNGLKKNQLIDFLHAGNFFALRSTLKTLPFLFDEQNFPFIGEERDLAYRLQLAGCQIHFQPQVELEHKIISSGSIWQAWKNSWEIGRAEGILVKIGRAHV